MFLYWLQISYKIVILIHMTTKETEEPIRFDKDEEGNYRFVIDSNVECRRCHESLHISCFVLCVKCRSNICIECDATEFGCVDCYHEIGSLSCSRCTIQDLGSYLDKICTECKERVKLSS